MTPLVSIVCPTRHRLPMLRKCIASIMETASDPRRIEIILRIHSDDLPTLQAIPDLLKLGPVRIAIGHPLSGYNDLTRFYEEAIALATGEWIWVMNDDVIIESPGWDQELRIAPVGHIVMPAIHKLGGSVYQNDPQTPFMFVPNGCWKRYLQGRPMRDPFDAGLWGLLRENGWPTLFIPVTVHHQRDVSAIEDRKRAEDELKYPEEQCRH